jgi:ectoine hydroxylase-related dioxygenase (phytanoyl-CoA dioxygenase family)
MSVPPVAALAHDERLIRIAREWLGGTAIPFRATLFEKSETTNWLIPWHQDTALPLAERVDTTGWGPWSEKAGVIYAHAPASALSRVVTMRVHLDASESDNGSLRVVPGSHTQGVLSDEAVGEVVVAGECVECWVARGGVVVMRPLIVHSSSKVRTEKPRRVLHIEYADCLEPGESVRLAVV